MRGAGLGGEPSACAPRFTAAVLALGISSRHRPCTDALLVGVQTWGGQQCSVLKHRLGVEKASVKSSLKVFLYILHLSPALSCFQREQKAEKAESGAGRSAFKGGALPAASGQLSGPEDQDARQCAISATLNCLILSTDCLAVCYNAWGK